MMRTIELVILNEVKDLNPTLEILRLRLRMTGYRDFTHQT